MRITDLTPQQTEQSNGTHPTAVASSATDLPFYRTLGRTNLTVSCLGLGGGSGISSDDALYAFDQGINYFFYSSDLHHFIYSFMGGAIRQLCRRGSSVREKVVLATVTYIKSPEMALGALFDQFEELGIDYIDIFFWGWIGTDDDPMFKKCLQLSPDLRGTNTVYQRTVERIYGASERLKKMGAVRYIGASFHDLDLAQQYLDSDLLDVVMVRHSVAHRSAQDKVFNRLNATDNDRPGIVTFRSTTAQSGPLWIAPHFPQTYWQPSPPDLYRYSLSQNCVDVCLMGSRDRHEIDAAIKGVQQGKLTNTELEYLNYYGDIQRQRLSLQDIPPDKLIYQPHSVVSKVN
jgi:predicted aldo/keto reductase-like oxidoreductase